MIADGPLAAAAEPSGLLEKISEFLSAARQAAADGLTWGEFGELMLAMVHLVASALDTVSSLSGQQKRQMVLDAVARLFDSVADQAIPLAVWPIWIIARPAVRSLVLALAGGVLEQLLPLVRAS